MVNVLMASGGDEYMSLTAYVINCMIKEFDPGNYGLTAHGVAGTPVNNSV